MPLTEQDRERIEAFRTFIADTVATDIRYGLSERHDRDDESTLATRFNPGPSCWFEVAVRPSLRRPDEPNCAGPGHPTRHEMQRC